MKPSRLLLMVVVLLAATLACELGAQLPSAATSTPKLTSTPKIGGNVFGAKCRPETLELEHGNAGEIGLDVEEGAKVTEWRIGSVSPADPGFAQFPEPEDGWSALPGAIEVPPAPVDGPPRTETYYINILVGGGRGTDQIVGGNIWCQVKVIHTELTASPTPTPTPEPTGTPTPTPTPRVIVTKDGFRIVYSGPLQTRTGGTLEATFQIMTADGQPARGTLVASLGDPPSDPRASHASGELDAEGKVTLLFDVNWPAGTTKLYISHAGEVFQIAEITINP